MHHSAEVSKHGFILHPFKPIWFNVADIHSFEYADVPSDGMPCHLYIHFISHKESVLIRFIHSERRRDYVMGNE